jgi:hypothetical protein
MAPNGRSGDRIWPADFRFLAHREMRPKTAVGRFRAIADSRKLCARRIYGFTP